MVAKNGLFFSIFTSSQVFFCACVMYVTVSVLVNSKNVQTWAMFLCSEKHRFAKLLDEVRIEPPTGRVTCSIFKDKDSFASQGVTVDLNFNVVECCALNSRFIRYSVIEAEEQRALSATLPPQKNAFSVMMVAARELRLPSKILSTPERYETGRGDHRVHDDVIDYMKDKGLGFSAGTGKQIVGALSKALFYMQPHAKTFHARIPNFVPPYFACLLRKVYNDPTAHKHASPPIKREALEKISAPLFSLKLLPLMELPRWKEFSVAVGTLAENFHKYKAYLEQQTEKMQHAHKSLAPLRSSACENRSGSNKQETKLGGTL